MSFKTNENPLCGFHSKSQSKLEAAFFLKDTSSNHQTLLQTFPCHKSHLQRNGQDGNCVI